MTVLYPFLKPTEITPTVLEILSHTIGRYEAFAASLAEVAWFGDSVCWLKPEPAQRFRELTLAVCEAFPGFKPYGGEYDDVVPHLTVGHDHPLPVLQAAAQDVTTALPVHASVTHVRLMARTEANWYTLCDFPLRAR